MRPSGIQHVNILVTDLDAARLFYGGVLGLEEIERPDLGSPGAWLRAGEQQLHLSVTTEPPARSAQHFALWVEDFDGAMDELKEKGVAVRRSDPIAGLGPQAFVRDPSGNLIELHHPL